MLDEYESYDIENGKYDLKYFGSESDKISHLWLKSRSNLVLQLSAKIIEDDSLVNDFSYYIITKNLSDEECILILGIVIRAIVPKE